MSFSAESWPKTPIISFIYELQETAFICVRDRIILCEIPYCNGGIAHLLITQLENYLMHLWGVTMETLISCTKKKYDMNDPSFHSSSNLLSTK